MAGYQRFVAYVYEYLRGKKGSNCGFVKVEVREETCRLSVQLQCEGLAGGAECRIWGFVRNGGLMDGILLGSCRTKEGIVSCEIETHSGNMNHSGISLGKMGGLVMTTENGAFFGTEWDDSPIRPDNFREKSLNRETEDQGEASEKVFREENRESEEGREQQEASVSAEEKSEEKPEEEPKEEPEKQEEKPQESEEKEPELVSQSIIEKEPEENQEPEKTEMPMEAVVKSEERTTESEQTPGGSEFLPFNDGDISECRQIGLKDLVHLNCRDQGLRSNRFVQHGYYQFGHLLLGKRQDGSYILGVPGAYEQQERFMANMFGFAWFRESRFIQIPGRRGGYWYRLIHTPDFH